MRTPTSLSERTRRTSSDAHRHDDAEVALVPLGADEHRVELVAEVESLRTDLAARDERVRALEGEVRDLLQTKRDVAKRIDDLIGQLDHFERDAERNESAAANV